MTSLYNFNSLNYGYSDELKYPLQGTVAKPQMYHSSTNVIRYICGSKLQEIAYSPIPLYGIELEYHKEKDLNNPYIKCLLDMGLFKSDLSVDGGEFVTVPYNMEHLLSHLFVYKYSLDWLLEGNDEGDTCGMHVHVSRRHLSNNQIENLVSLLNPSCDEGQAYWSEVADRDLNTYKWCSFIDYPSWKQDWDDGYSGLNRNVLVNLRNEHTVEFRMFKSPSSSEGVIHNLKIVKALIEFSKVSGEFDEWLRSPMHIIR